jgi:ketosteroid isomerase-like protein
MSANEDLVREAFSAFMSGDVDRALAATHPDVISVRAAPLPDPQTYHGREGILQMYADWTADFEEFEMNPVEFTEIGDRVIVEMIQRGTGRASGVTIEGLFWLVYTVAGGRITRQDAFLTREQALASPPP